MTALVDRFPGLSRIAHVELGVARTPVERLDRVSAVLGREIWCKRDDLTSADYGGNKVRKLEFLLADAKAKGARAVITAGAAGSHHCLATTMFATRLGLEAHLLLAPQATSEHVEENLRVDLGLGAHVHPVSTFAAIPHRTLALRASLRARGMRPYVIPPGGSSPVGAFGYVEAGLELAAQLERGMMPTPKAIFLALGTAGTVVGAAVGLAAAGLEARVVCVRVTDLVISNRLVLRSLARRVVAKLRRADPTFPEVRARALDLLEIDHAQFGDGYGFPTPASTEAVALAAKDGLHLETTYTAKAFASLVRHAREADDEPLLYWHTLSSAALGPLAARAPAVPPQLARLLR